MKRFKKILLVLNMTVILLATSMSFVFAAEPGNTTLSSGCTLSPGKTTSVPLFIQNNDSGTHSYNVTAGGMTNNYELYFASGGAPAKAIEVQPGTNAEIDLNISMKGTPSADTDQLTVTTIRDDGKESSVNLTVAVNKDYALSISNMLNKIDTLSGKSTEVTFSVTNNGTKELSSVKLEPELPYKWIAGQSSDTGINLKPGETGTLKMNIDVPSSQTAGNFTAKFAATSNETKSDQISIPVTVKTSSNIAYWMIGALLVIAVFTAVQFKRHGRR
ncbi:NEW3 domain-containing protein [Sinanaerobacter chloroacetimidivorans]|uniref:Alpha-galactosidase NEW3 domain-containing protein n=1 Tax=Sinanaerobacter chloroacetimidivorans TaxID=2818044 RepID=A0A8J7W3X2_9FIRM|nr:NEW3 domain-containing protein [Sinanaerobacter chloroacetimidivorans]MBR0598475.1 hypothetical protein [Sinanaerobacter chloroacetimidivorans]